MIVVTGASGQVGGRVTKLLQRPHALLVRDPAKAPQTDKELKFADYSDTAAMTAALEGAETLFLVSGREDPNRLAQHKSAIDAAVQAKVQRIVYLSFAGAAKDCTFTFGRDHWYTEQYIRETELAFTFLRDNMYLEMIPRLADEHGVIRGPGGDGRVAAVSYDDIAASVVAVLDEPQQHDGKTYTLTGPEAFSLQEAAEKLRLRYVPETVEEAYASRAHYGAPDFEVAGWVTSYQAIANGELAEVTDHVERLTGRRPKELRGV
ncbi:SDR family oxidoreductase [Dactylosporangium matsuzakiense]|uniref:NAD(P)-dependent oxidoreductase n=1 Tax=Dactylosporangium matsuzakiense TaxID=53360 RepID=A0A9W6KMM5_9ACTN|nr:SDR family oxidoreductase [Dactylosporangium matsuzakiense]GLL03675.1 NAD(P)-dependent oxidoreductase [Dactylosporangium matsuzakiense]